jgi:tRNA (guanine-N7-)-methyltransferase
VVSYVRRSPRLTPGQQKSWDRFSHRWLIDVPRGGHRTSIDPDHRIDVDQHFGRRAPLIVEIGPGMGESLIPMALARAEANVLAFEVYPPGIARILASLAEAGATNVRLIQANAVDGLRLLDRGQPLAQLWTFFPDPWHKTKHRKRRLITGSFADLVASRLQLGGLWRLATDWPDYAKQIRTVLDGHDRFENAYPDDGAPRTDRPVTKFEQRGVDQGREISDFVYRR